MLSSPSGILDNSVSGDEETIFWGEIILPPPALGMEDANYEKEMLAREKQSVRESSAVPLRWMLR